MIKVFNVRLGHACNSSSSHSIIFLPREQRETMRVKDDGVEDRRFGWDFWMAASEQAKRDYLGTMLCSRLARNLPEDVARLVCKDWVGSEVDPDWYVDHQSMIGLPADFVHPAVPDEGFVKALLDYLLREDLVILGGNDNVDEGEHHPLGSGLRLDREMGASRSSVCRHDEENQYWSIFDRENGNKYRFRFRDGPGFEVKPTKSEVPELVDVRLTSKCDQGCPFCYADARPDGAVADGTSIWRLARALGEMRTFEVALGGGEPLLLPNLASILAGFRSEGVVPNFTTRKLDWLRDPRKWKPIIENVGSFALSVNAEERGYDRINELGMLLRANDIPLGKAAIQAIVRDEPDAYCVSSPSDMERMIKRCAAQELRLTFLGFKRVGRARMDKGPRGQGNPPGWWVVPMRDAHARYGGSIGIDTALAASAGAGLNDNRVPVVLYDVKEGQFSCYVDLLEKKIGPSSYCKPGEMLPLADLEAEEIRWKYAKF